MSQTEFWRDLKPIERVFRTDAKPEAYELCKPHYEQSGLGADYLQSLIG